MQPTPTIDCLESIPLKIAFYSPLKAPDHPTPSGDRTMARLLIRALELAGHEVEIVSHLRSFSLQPSPRRLQTLEAEAREELARLLDATTFENATLPDLWLTYHPYYKAPDLLGPAFCEVNRIPYVTVEASHASKRSRGEWQKWQAYLDTALNQAALNICMTERDADGLEAFLKTGSRIARLPAFIDTGDLMPAIRNSTKQTVRLVSVAMMRSGDKLESYRFLAQSLQKIAHLPWHLTIIGGGSQRDEVESLFQPVAFDRVQFTGELEQKDVYRHLAKSDIFLWPGLGEAYGLAYLEAQAHGLPVVALNCAGVSSVVINEMTGLLIEPLPDYNSSLQAYARAVERLLTDKLLRRDLALGAARFVRDERDLISASDALDTLLRQVQYPHLKEALVG